MSKFIEEELSEQESFVFMQWKGTDVCLDFHCKCGNFFHVHGDFVYFVKCQECNTVYEMPSYVFPRVVTGEPLIDPKTGDQGEED